MKIWESRLDGVVILGLQGRFDSTSVPEFESKTSALLESGDLKFVLDFEHLDYASSMALRCLLVLAKKAQGAGGKVCLLSVPDRIREILELTGFASLFPMFSSREEAAQSC